VLVLHGDRLPIPAEKTTEQGLTILAGTSAAGQAPAPGQRVLVLYSDERLLPANIIMDEAIRAAFAAGTKNPVELYSEFLDVARFPGEEQQQRQVAVVSGSGPRDRQFADVYRKEMTPFGNRVAFTWLTNLSMEELRGELSRLADHTVVLFLTMFQDAAGKTFTSRQALDAFAPASRVPIYGYYDTYVGHGIVGGWMVTFEEIGRKAAQLGVRILAGEDPQAAARSESYRAVPIFDWRQLRQWNISEQGLPPGSIVRFKEATYWEQHYRIIITALSLCLLEALLIVALLVQLRRRRLAEAALRESERRLTLAASAAHLGIWIR